MEVLQTLPSFRSSFHIEIKTETGDGEVSHYSYVGDIPREIMDAYQQVAGNGQARVSVSADFGVKEYGNGVSCTVLVSLSCNQDQGTLLHAIELAGGIARWAVRDQHQKAEAEYQALMAAKQQSKPGGPSYR